MKNLRSKLIRLTPSLVLLLLWSCNDGKLSNSEAEKQLKNEYPRYITSTIQINDNSLSPGIPNDLKLLSERDLATYNFIPPGVHGYGCYGVLSEEAKQYIIRPISYEFVEMAIAKVDLDRVTGIREVPAMNVSEIEYNEKIVEVTPIGEIYNRISIGQTYNVTATYNKYNDGWRIANISTRAQKITISNNFSKANDSQAKYADVQEFFNAFKKAVLSKNMKEISQFVRFPLRQEGESMSKEEFLSGVTIVPAYFELVTQTNSLTKYGENDYGIPRTGMKFTKHRDGFWKLDVAYDSPDFWR